MKHFFVIGNKASQSLSPLIFNYWFKKYNIKARYSFLQVPSVSFDKTLIKTKKNKNICGLNVTTPFKKNILKHLDSKEKHAINIGAVNCVTLGKRAKGANTDWIGYLNSIKKEKISRSKTILILGYGGASQAILYGLNLKGYKKTHIFNRSKKIIKINNINKYTKNYSLIDNYLVDAGLIINTTPTNPLNKKQINLIKKNTVVSDIVYNPKETKFLKHFSENKRIFGISMLIEQAAPCFYKWFGVVPKADSVLLKKLNNKIK